MHIFLWIYKWNHAWHSSSKRSIERKIALRNMAVCLYYRTIALISYKCITYRNIFIVSQSDVNAHCKLWPWSWESARFLLASLATCMMSFDEGTLNGLISIVFTSCDVRKDWHTHVLTEPALCCAGVFLTACGPSDGKEVKDVFGRPGARVDIGSARKRSLAAHGVGARQQVKIWKLDICPVTI